jgi:hypothetical protein
LEARVQINLKTTILASSALAGLLNLIQFAESYDQHARAAFAPAWADAATNTPAKTTSIKNTVATPSPTAPAPASDPSLAAAAKLSTAGLNPVFAPNYLSVQTKTGTPWQLLAAVHETETGQSGDTNRKSYAGATGPMQFMPGTFSRYALDGDGNGTKDITDFDDALLSAGNYLRAGGAAGGHYYTALYNYNHSSSYVNHVLSIAHKLGL